MLKSKLYVAGLLLVLGVMVGCGSQEVMNIAPDTTKQDLMEKVWIVESLFDRKIVGDVELTMQFSPDGTVNGSAGCNNYSGKFQLAGEALKFGPMATTKKSCGPSLDEQEYTFIGSLNQIKELRIDGDELHLIPEQGGEPMVLTTGDGGGFW